MENYVMLTVPEEGCDYYEAYAILNGELGNRWMDDCHEKGHERALSWMSAKLDVPEEDIKTVEVLVDEDDYCLELEEIDVLIKERV